MADLVEEDLGDRTLRKTYEGGSLVRLAVIPKTLYQAPATESPPASEAPKAPPVPIRERMRA
ncbi:MAG: hypothetical protein ACT4PT_12205, partial [Methanobacteriota archaeon]